MWTTFRGNNVCMSLFLQNPFETVKVLNVEFPAFLSFLFSVFNKYFAFKCVQGVSKLGGIF